MKQPIKLAIVDDSDLYRLDIINQLARYKTFRVVIESPDGKSFIDKLADDMPDIVLLDLGMPVMDGMETTEYLSKHHPQIKILILTADHDELVLLELLRKGANGFLLKDNSIQEIAAAVYALSKHKYFFDGWDLKKIVTAKKTAVLSQELFSPQEIEVIKLLYREKTTKEISAALHISPRTVEGCRRRIYKKANVLNTAGLVLYAVERDLV
jgi:DNA-binding NarL/FixJ family response regulator